MATVGILEAGTARRLGDSPEAFVRALGSPAIVRFAGRDRSRARVASVLLHGNERSGLVALFRLLRDGVEPAVDLDVLIGAVDAAAGEPAFAHRMLPGRRDLNRCFVFPPDDQDGDIARQALSALTRRRIECAVDLHNNTGRNPSYGVVTMDTAETRSLVSLFTDTCVATDLRLGSFMEAMTEVCPAVTIECGRAGQGAADDIAYAGLRAFAERDRIVPSPQGLRMYHCDRRVQLVPGTHVDFADAATGNGDLTLRADLERFNFTSLPAGEVLGWVRADAVPLVVADLGGEHTGEDVFALEDGALVARRALLPAMISTDASAVAADCLCYLMEQGHELES